MTERESHREGRLRLGTPLWLLLAGLVTVAYVKALLVPSGAATTPAAPVVQPGILSVLLAAPGALAALSGFALLAPLAVAGPRATLSGLRFLLGRARETELPDAARALGAAASTVLNAGFVLGALGILFLCDHTRRVWLVTRSSATPEDHLPAPATFAEGVQMALVVPLLGILLGRFLLGAPAEAAARRAGLEQPSFSTSLQLLSMATVPAVLVFLFMKFPTLSGH